MQRGYIFHTGHPLSEGGKGKGAWHVRYYQQDGTQKCARLGPWWGEPTPPDSIRKQADSIIAPHQKHCTPEVMPFVEYVECVYLPVRKINMRAPSYAADENIWNVIKPHLERLYPNLLLCQIGPKHGKEILNSIHSEKPRSRNSYNRMRSFLNGIVRYALSEGIKNMSVAMTYAGRRPVTTMQTVSLPKGIPPREKRIYSAEQIRAILAVLEEPTRTIVHIAAATGLRKAEIQGLQWEDLDVDGDCLHVRRSVWFGKGGFSVNETKTEASAATVPIDTALLEALLRLKHADSTGWIFRSKRNGGQDPRHLSNLESTAIIPKLDEISIPWLGWHAFRHSFATLLNNKGIDMKTRQALLRHKDPHTTQAVYTHADEDAKRAASDVVSEALAGKK